MIYAATVCRVLIRTLGAVTTSSLREFQGVKTRSDKTCFLMSNRVDRLASLSECPLVRVSSESISKPSITPGVVDVMNYFVHFYHVPS